MKQLSSRAENYLNSLDKDREWCCDKDIATNYLEQQEVPVYKSVIRYQTRYSGLDLTIRGNQDEAFFMRLFSKENIKDNEPISILEEGNNVLFECGYHQTAQYNFFINENGEIIAQSGDDEIVIYSSAEMMVESYALLDSIADGWHWCPYHCDIKDVNKLNAFLTTRNFQPIKDCCDAYNQYFSNGNIIVRCSVWWDSTKDFCLSCYGKEEKACQLLIEQLEKERII